MKTEILYAERQAADQALRESEQRYKRLLAATTDYIYSVEFHDGWSTTIHGPGSKALTGYTPEEFGADPFLWYRVIHEEDRPAVLAQVERIMQGQVPPPVEHRLLHKDGSIRWIKNTPIPHVDHQGRLVGYDGLISDITESRRAEQFLTCQYEVTRDLAEAPTLEEALPKVFRDLCVIFPWEEIVYWTVRDPGKESAADNQWSLLAGWKRKQSMSAEPSCNGAPPPVIASLPLLQRVVNTGAPVCAPGAAGDQAAGLEQGCTCAVPVRLDGRAVGVIELRSEEVRPPDEHVQQVLSGAASQISLFIEQDNAEKALRKSQERLALVIEGSTDGIWDWDIPSGQTYFSPRWKAMLGYSDKEVANTAEAWVELLHPEDKDRVLEGLKSYFEMRSSSYEVEFRMRHKDGTWRWILARGAALRDETGWPVRMAGSHVDLTERKVAAVNLEAAYAKLAKRGTILKRLVRELRASHRELKEAQRHLIEAARLESVGTLAAGVAHEVKNPLQIILMGLDFLERQITGAPKDLIEVLGDMREAVTRASSVIREMLVLSSNTQFQTQPEDLNRILRRSLRMLSTSVVAAQAEVALDFAPDLPPVTADANKLQQVFINLILNSLHAMAPHGKLSVSTRTLELAPASSHTSFLHRKFKPGDRLVIAELRDTGQGIPPEILPRIFDPFFTTKPVGVGTGLGLPVARKIIDLHHGEIEIRNDPAGGVIARVILKA